MTREYVVIDDQAYGLDEIRRALGHRCLQNEPVLSLEQISDVRRRAVHGAGGNIAALADEYRVTPRTIQRYLRRTP